MTVLNTKEYIAFFFHGEGWGVGGNQSLNSQIFGSFSEGRARKVRKRSWFLHPFTEYLSFVDPGFSPNFSHLGPIEGLAQEIVYLLFG